MNIKAFPIDNITVNGETQLGMDLLDYFAGQALISGKLALTRDRDIPGFAKDCYKIAQAMIDEREKRLNSK